MLVNLFIGVVEVKGYAVASWRLWFLGTVFTPLVVALCTAILPSRGVGGFAYGFMRPLFKRCCGGLCCEMVVG